MAATPTRLAAVRIEGEEQGHQRDTAIELTVESEVAVWFSQRPQQCMTGSTHDPA